MNINTVSASSRVQTSRVFTAASETTTGAGPKDTLEPALDWGFRAQPVAMAAAGGFTTVGAGILGSLAGAIHPLAGTVVGGVVGAAVGYLLPPAQAGGGAKIGLSALGGVVGAVSGYAGANSNVATYAILAGAGVVGGYVMGQVVKHAFKYGL